MNGQKRPEVPEKGPKPNGPKLRTIVNMND
jgi:hypothetical protein